MTRVMRWEWGRTILAVLSILMLMFTVQPMEAQEDPDGGGDSVMAVTDAPTAVASASFTDSAVSLGAVFAAVVSLGFVSFLLIVGGVDVLRRTDHWKQNFNRRRESEGWRPALTVDSR